MQESGASRSDVIAARKAWAVGALERVNEQIKTHEENVKNGVLSATPEQSKVLRDQKAYIDGIIKNPGLNVPKTKEELDALKSGNQREGKLANALSSGSRYIKNEAGVSILPKELSPVDLDIESNIIDFVGKVIQAEARASSKEMTQGLWSDEKSIKRRK